MTLYSPARPTDIDLTAPHLHALVIGVGEYPHLMGGPGLPAVATFGLQQLTTTTLTAVRIAEWLAQDYRNAACPLGSVELLLSPAQAVTPPNLPPVNVDVSTMDNIRVAIDAWYKRCDAHQGNIAFLYFAGHGISTVSQLLLAADFGSPTYTKLWRNCIDFDGLRVGMRKNAADTQLFFVDACREKVIDALIQLNATGDPLVDGATISDQVAASAAYFAAADGLQAYGPAQDVTYFGAALLESLEGAGAHNTQSRWVVDIFSLGNSLGQIISSIAKREGKALTCNPDPQGIVKPIHYPSSALVKTVISCSTPQANSEASIQLARLGQHYDSPKGDPRPWTNRVPPGDWDLTMSFTTLPAIARRETLMPPLFELEEPI